MAVRLVGLLGKPVIVHDLTADECFEWKGSQHVESETETRNVDEEVIVGEIV